MDEGFKNRNVVRVVKVADLEPGMRVVKGKGLRVWKVDTNLGWRWLHLPHLGKSPKWQHVIVFRRLEQIGDDEITFFWTFSRSDATVDVME